MKFNTRWSVSFVTLFVSSRHVREFQLGTKKNQILGDFFSRSLNHVPSRFLPNDSSSFFRDAELLEKTNFPVSASVSLFPSVDSLLLEGERSRAPNDSFVLFPSDKTRRKAYHEIRFLLVTLRDRFSRRNSKTPDWIYRTNVSNVFARLSSRNGVLSLNDIVVSILGCNNYGANRRKLLLYKMARHWP